jgi:hypothetical protein
MKLCSLHNSLDIVQQAIGLNGSKDCREDESDLISSDEEQGAASAQATCFASCELDETEKLSFCDKFPSLIVLRQRDERNQ